MKQNFNSNYLKVQWFDNSLKDIKKLKKKKHYIALMSIGTWKKPENFT